MKTKIAIGSDHAGYALKAVLLARIAAMGLEIEDFGTRDASSVDYPDFAHAVANAIESGRACLGILVCGTGVGMSIAANRHPGVRAAVVSDTFSARMAREHNNANVLCMGARVVGEGLAADILQAFLDATFEGGRHVRRVEKIERK